MSHVDFTNLSAQNEKCFDQLDVLSDKTLTQRANEFRPRKSKANNMPHQLLRLLRHSRNRTYLPTLLFNRKLINV